ncbi:hypothetical protein CXF67_08875 [Psychroflexus sp. MES1-P1E]|nr:hypothetical protein CXF67_08875 [Psychroflexus sp. MES1-P1E]
MKFKITFLIFITVIMVGCNNDDDTVKSSLENSNKIRVDEDLFSTAPNDDFEIITTTITDNNLNLTIHYGGGCGNIYYDLISGNDYTETEPIQRNIRLAFDDKDNCEAGIEIDLSFDLTQIQISSTDRIFINLDRWENQIEYNY